MPRAKTAKKTDAAPPVAADAEPVWAYGVRTWAADGKSYDGNFSGWDLTPGARTTAPDWKPTAECGNGLHCNPDGLGDWSLLSDAPDAIIGVVRYDAALAIDLDGKIKAPWMEVVLTSKSASRPAVMGLIAQKAREKIAALTAEAATARASRDGEHAHADSGHASAAGDRGHASAAGDSGHASAAGKFGVAAALGIEGTAQAADTGAIVLTAWAQHRRTGEWELKAVFAGMVGQTYGAVTIKPGVRYRLGLDGVPVEVA